jgi:hypothetical protein
MLESTKPIAANATGEYNKYELIFDESELESIKTKIFKIMHTL